MKLIKKVDIRNGLRSIGVKESSVVLIKADLGSIGLVESMDPADYLNAILDAIGPDGTIVAAAFTRLSIFPKKENYFNSAMPSYCGALTELMLKHEKSHRSEHPSNSFVAIGPRAKEILSGHNHETSAYLPVQRVVDIDGLMLNIGNYDIGNNPGFFTRHLAEVNSGLDKKVLLPKLSKVYFSQACDNKLRVFKRRDHGLCGTPVVNVYPKYFASMQLQTSMIGSAFSMLIPAKVAYEIDHNYLNGDLPPITLCGNKNCFSCQARRKDNISAIPGYIIRYLIKKIRGQLNARKR